MGGQQKWSFKRRAIRPFVNEIDAGTEKSAHARNPGCADRKGLAENNSIMSEKNIVKNIPTAERCGIGIFRYVQNFNLFEMKMKNWSLARV